jgi:hypothetical protein
VVIVMTPAEWEAMFTVAHGSFDSAFDRVKQTLLAWHVGGSRPTDAGPARLGLPEQHVGDQQLAS